VDKCLSLYADIPTRGRLACTGGTLRSIRCEHETFPRVLSDLDSSERLVARHGAVCYWMAFTSSPRVHNSHQSEECNHSHVAARV
jgi:hypothetical protein